MSCSKMTDTATEDIGKLGLTSVAPLVRLPPAVSMDGGPGKPMAQTDVQRELVEFAPKKLLELAKEKVFQSATGVVVWHEYTKRKMIQTCFLKIFFQSAPRVVV